MKNKTGIAFSILSLSFIAAFFCKINVQADAIWIELWYWHSDMRPYKILPVLVMVTVIIEVLIINYGAEILDYKKVTKIVLIANVLSFAAPYSEYIWTAYLNNGMSTFRELLEENPSYIIGAAFMLVTLIVELPVVYAGLRKRTEKRGKLVGMIIISNILTTLLCKIMEDWFCKGSYIGL